MAQFETLGEIASIYNLDLNALLDELRQDIENPPAAN
jgi:hypothetical protein